MEGFPASFSAARRARQAVQLLGVQPEAPDQLRQHIPVTAHQGVPPLLDLMEFLGLLVAELVQFIHGLTQGLRVDLAHDRADELQLAPPGLLVLQGVVEAHGLGQVLGQAQALQLLGRQFQEALAELLQGDHVALAL